MRSSPRAIMVLPGRPTPNTAGSSQFWAAAMPSRPPALVGVPNCGVRAVKPEATSNEKDCTGDRVRYHVSIDSLILRQLRELIHSRLFYNQSHVAEIAMRYYLSSRKAGSLPEEFF